MIKPRKFVSNRLRAKGINTIKQFQQLKSTSNAEALNIKQFQLPPIYMNPRSAEIQLKWMYGKLPFDKVAADSKTASRDEYPDTTYRDLVQELT